jgi:hypothetical protein
VVGFTRLVVVGFTRLVVVGFNHRTMTGFNNFSHVEPRTGNQCVVKNSLCYEEFTVFNPRLYCRCYFQVWVGFF